MPKKIATGNINEFLEASILDSVMKENQCCKLEIID
jgi:hypothetical protein